MNKTIQKTIRIGAGGIILYGLISTTLSMGEGLMLGLLAKHNLDAIEAIEVLKEYREGSIPSHIRRRFVRLIALKELEKES